MSDGRALLAEFGSADALLSGVREVLQLVPPERIEAYTPFPLEELDELLQIPRSGTPRWGLAGGLIGLGLAGLGQWWITAVDYPLDVGGRPINPLPAYVPVMVELTILGVALGALLGLMWECRLLRLWDRLFEVPTFERASRDRFFLKVSGGETGQVMAALQRGGAWVVQPC